MSPVRQLLHFLSCISKNLRKTFMCVALLAHAQGYMNVNVCSFSDEARNRKELNQQPPVFIRWRTNGTAHHTRTPLHGLALSNSESARIKSCDSSSSPSPSRLQCSYSTEGLSLLCLELRECKHDLFLLSGLTDSCPYYLRD